MRLGYWRTKTDAVVIEEEAFAEFLALMEGEVGRRSRTPPPRGHGS
jgi:hypothetical protein